MYEVFFEQNKKTRTHYADTETPKGEQYLSAKNDVPCLCNMYESENSKRLDEKVLCMFASNEAGETLYATSIQFSKPNHFYWVNYYITLFLFCQYLNEYFIYSTNQLMYLPDRHNAQSL